MLTREQIELRGQWTDALRSGAYRQGLGNLKLVDFSGTHHCCLGVLCEITGLPSRYFKNASVFYFKFPSGRESSTRLSLSYLMKLGLSAEQEGILIMMNDSSCSFNEIAARIDAWTVQEWTP